MKLSSTIAAALSLLAFGRAGAQGARPLEPADFVVRGVTAEADSARVVALLGAPDSVSTEASPYDPASRLTAMIYPALRVRMANGKVLGVGITGAGIETARGLKVGDPAARARQLYGEANGRFEDALEFPDPHDPTGHHVMRVELRGGAVSRIFLGWVFE